MNQTITSVPGIAAGHASLADGSSGCTVILGPFRGAVDVRGHATGTREIETLSPLHVAGRADAVLLGGGSAPGLAAADGVVAWLRERGRGFEAGAARIPIVPAAVIFDVQHRDFVAPDAALGRAACDATARTPIAEGRAGAGAGATVGKLRGRAHASPGGVGSFAVSHGRYRLGALAVVNAFGDVLDAGGGIVAGARDDDGAFIDSLRACTDPGLAVPSPAANTTLCVIATDAPLSRTALLMVARAGSNAVARRTAPAATIFDGDVVFALSTATHVEDATPADLLAITAAAQLTLEEAILRAVRQ